VAIRDATLGQIVGGEFHRDAITCENPDSVAAKLASQVGEYGTVGIQLNTEQSTRELFNDGPGHFNTIFFTHLPLRCWNAARVAVLRRLSILQLQSSPNRMKMMARRRFFVPEVRSGRAVVGGDEARHLTQVLRVETGQIFEISDNQAAYLAEIEAARRAEVTFRILDRLAEPPPETPVDLLISLIKFDRLELLIEKATELGVTSIHFIRAERSEKGLDKAANKRIERWRRIALEASQQSRRLRLPDLHEPIRLKDALARPYSHRFFLDEERTGAPLLNALTAPVESVGLLIGPEGGWPGHERAAAREAGWTPVSLGAHILRAETAGIAALALVNAALGRGESPEKINRPQEGDRAVPDRTC
jgi:16S rRNA (uracil1498-N3)-methyltransferase